MNDNIKKILALMILLPAFVFAGSYHGMYLLDMPLQSNANAAGMGNLTVLPAKSAANAVFAPYMLSDHEGFFAHAQTELAQRTERREMPLFDSFDEVVYMSAYTNNKNTYLNPSIYAGYRYEFGDFAPSVSAGYAPIYDLTYLYEDVEGNLDDEIEQTHLIESSGMLAGPSFAVSLTHNRWGGIGFGMAMASGQAEYSRTSFDEVMPGKWETLLHADSAITDLSATITSIQAVVTPTHRIEIGLRYTPTIDIDVDYKEMHITGTYPYDEVYTETLPARMGIGFSYKPSGNVPSRFVFEAEQFAWSDLADEKQYESFKDEWSFRFGIEHKLPPGTIMRGGAYHYKLPVSGSSPVAKTGLTVGTSFSAWVATFDFALGYETSKYDTSPIFDVARTIPEDTEAFDTVRDNRLFGNIGMSVEF